jgi:hypothetical protein
VNLNRKRTRISVSKRAVSNVLSLLNAHSVTIYWNYDSYILKSNDYKGDYTELSTYDFEYLIKNCLQIIGEEKAIQSKMEFLNLLKATLPQTERMKGIIEKIRGKMEILKVE